jgi:phycocyanobilin lyase beta subunit
MTPDLAQVLIHDFKTADSAPSLIEAVEKLAAARIEAAIPLLIEALGYNNPGVAVAAVAGLAQMGEPAVQPLLDQLDDYNYGARAWAVRALSLLADPRALQTLLEAAQNDFALSVRRASARGLGALKWEMLPADQVQPTQQRVLSALWQVSQDPEWVVRYAAVNALQELAVSVAVTRTDWALEILAHLAQQVDREESAAVIARIWLAQKEIHQYAIDLLNSQPMVTVQTLSTTLREDWRSTLEKLYSRKQQERPVPEGDPRKFLAAAATVTADKG